jgi:uncharacterized surface protein with fasciclin (FAS1) repeats
VRKCQGYPLSVKLKELTNATSKFTLPAPLSVTEQAVGINTFASLASSANLTDTFDSIPYSTFFIPSDEAFASFNASTPSTATANLLEGHLIPDFVGYLPSLVNGSTLTTQAGSIVTVTIRGDDYYINDALIVSSNIILDNGVAHVIDGVCLVDSLMFPIAFLLLSLRLRLTDPVRCVIGPYSSPGLYRGCVFYHTEGKYGSFRGCSHSRAIPSHYGLNRLNRGEKMNGMAEIGLGHLIIVAYFFVDSS